MQRVARDWSMSIRASQIVPVYPLSQDIQPGDVFLVDRTVAKQSKTFRERGFLPTDLRVTRLVPDNYGEFYSGREVIAGIDSGHTLTLPRDWRNTPNPTSPWEQFPRAGFPSYSFRVSNSSGLSVAVPVQGVPVALSATGAARANGSITISDAVTYGTDASSIYRLLLEADQLGKLDYVVPPPGHDVRYLRVITRVFAARSFDVTLVADSTLGGGGDAGAPQTVSDSSGRLENGVTVEDINSQLASIGQALAESGLPLPGGSIRATFASGRTISFKETFPEPIVVGYHGFDVVIDESGAIGPLIPTFQVLDQGVMPLQPTAIQDSDSAYRAILELLRNAPPERAAAVFELAAANSSGLLGEYQQALSERPDNPVGVWVSVTHTAASTQSGRDRLLGWLSRSIRETEE